MGCHAGTALPLPGSCPRTYTVHLHTGTSETYIGSQPATPGGGFVYYGHTHYIGTILHVINMMYDGRYMHGSTGHEEVMHIQDT